MKRASEARIGNVASAIASALAASSAARGRGRAISWSLR